MSLPASRTVRHRSLITLGVLLTLLGLGAAWLSSLPDVRPLNNPGRTVTIEVQDWQGRIIPFDLGPANPTWTPLSHIPSHLKWAIVIAEDDTFYHHDGFNLTAIKDAFMRNLEEGRMMRGGSTITQQLAKNLYLSRKKSIARKAKEAIITRRMERHLSKDRILELYLNLIELGPAVYGVGQGSRYLFGKKPAQLDLCESALLAAIIPSPKRYDPRRFPHKAMKRYHTVLHLMHISRRITSGQYEMARSARLYVDSESSHLLIEPPWADE